MVYRKCDGEDYNKILEISSTSRTGELPWRCDMGLARRPFLTEAAFQTKIS